MGLLILLLWLPSTATASPALFAFPGAPDADPWPEARRAHVWVARQGLRTTLTLAPDLHGEVERFGLIVPLPTAPLGWAVVPPVRAERVEAFGAPRLQAITCDDLVQEEHAITAPGCTSYDPPAQPEARLGEPTVGNLALSGAWTSAHWSISVVTVAPVHDGLQDWLDVHELTLGPGARAALDEALAAASEPVSLLAASVVPRGIHLSGSWIEPLQVTWEHPELVLPLWGAADATGPFELVLTALTEHQDGGLAVADAPRASVESDCLLRPEELETWSARAFDDALRTDPPSWLPAYSGPADQCGPCLGDPLLPAELSDLGFAGMPEAAWVSRLQMRWDPETRPDALRLTPEGPAPTQLTWVAWDPALTFAWPVCGEGFVDEPGVCDGLTLDGGCDTAPVRPRSPRWTWLVVAALLLAARRRSVAVASVLLLLIGLPAQARAPVFELSASASAISTPRVRFLDQDGASPRLPMLGVDVRAPVLRVHDSLTAGVTAGARGFIGDGTPVGLEGPVVFRFVEPHLGVDFVWAGDRRVTPFARAGLQAALGVLAPSVWRTRATLAGMLHGGGGLRFGDGPVPLLVELQLTVVPRTDGFVTTWHDQTGLPNWSYQPGSADLALRIGVGFR